MLNELDGAPLGLADQLCEPPLAIDQRQAAQAKAMADAAATRDEAFRSVLGSMAGQSSRAIAKALTEQGVEPPRAAPGRTRPCSV